MASRSNHLYRRHTMACMAGIQAACPNAPAYHHALVKKGGVSRTAVLVYILVLAAAASTAFLPTGLLSPDVIEKPILSIKLQSIIERRIPMYQKVRKAVIPAAGLGTRVLPITKSMPKEMLPIVDKPAIQYIVEEAVRSGITDILIITNRGKEILEDHFDHSIELEERLAQSGKNRYAAAGTGNFVFGQPLLHPPKGDEGTGSRGRPGQGFCRG